MTQVVSSVDLANAVRAAITARLATMSVPTAAYELDEAREKAENGTLDTDYVLVEVTRDLGGNERVGPHISPTMWVLEVEAVARFVSNLGTLLDQATAALEHQIVTVAGVESTPIRFESESAVRPNYPHKALLSRDRTFTFAF